MGVKFSMRSAAPSDHARRTGSSGVDPGAMAAPLPEAAEPVATSTNGPVRAASNSIGQKPIP